MSPREEVLREIILGSIYNDIKVPITEFKLRSDQFRFKFSKNLMKNKLAGHFSIYQKLKKANILLKQDGALVLNPALFSRLSFNYNNDGYIRDMAIELKVKGKPVIYTFIL